MFVQVKNNLDKETFIIMKKLATPLLTTLLFSTVAFTGVSASAATTPDPATAETPIEAQLTINQTPTPPTAPTGADGGADKATALTGLFGIAYAPDKLSVSDTLNDAGQQKLALSNNNVAKYNVGVQDKTRRNDQQWTLKAKLTWSGANANYMTGTSIEASNGNVQENKAGALTALTDSQVTTTAQSLKINETETAIMASANGKTMNGVYNYQFESPELVIPNVENVPAGTYNGTINWNLETTPTTQP